jgi:hypothetical protein
MGMHVIILFLSTIIASRQSFETFSSQVGQQPMHVEQCHVNDGEVHMDLRENSCEDGSEFKRIRNVSSGSFDNNVYLRVLFI